MHAQAKLLIEAEELLKQKPSADLHSKLYAKYTKLGFLAEGTNGEPIMPKIAKKLTQCLPTLPQDDRAQAIQNILMWLSTEHTSTAIEIADAIYKNIDKLSSEPIGRFKILNYLAIYTGNDAFLSGNESAIFLAWKTASGKVEELKSKVTATKNAVLEARRLGDKDKPEVKAGIKAIHAAAQTARDEKSSAESIRNWIDNTARRLEINLSYC